MVLSKSTKIWRRIQLTVERIFFVILAVAFAKVCEYSAVDAIGARLGFDLAAISGLIPAMSLILFIEFRILRPRYAAPAIASRAMKKHGNA